MYLNWSPQVQIAARNLNWYNIQELIHAFHSVQNFFRGNSTERRSFRNPFRELQTNPPCDKNHRFPNDQVYICQGHKTWGKRLDLVFLYASVILGNKLQREYENAGTIGEAESYLLTLIHNILVDIEHFEGLFDRQYFETHYQIEWIDRGLVAVMEESGQEAECSRPDPDSLATLDV